MKFTDRYPLRPFQVTDPDLLQRVISQYPLAMVISPTDVAPAVSQLPLMHVPSSGSLQGHLDRNNPHCEAIARGGDVYAVFTGPNHYMSPSIYPDTQYPGWNYVSVHVEGTVKPIEDPEWLTELLLRTAEENEPGDSGYRLKSTQAGFDTLLDYILGFEIDITDMRGVFKLAQDKGIGHARLARDHLSEILARDISGFIGDLLEPKTSGK